jgi:hypothetical protein
MIWLESMLTAALVVAADQVSKAFVLMPLDFQGA